MTTMPADIQNLEELTRTSVEEFSNFRREPSWLKDLRLAAWEAYAALPWPKRNDEEWQRTDLKALGFPHLTFLTHDSQERKTENALLVSDSDLKKGVQVLPMPEAVSKAEALVRPRLEQGLANAQGKDKFTCLTLALSSAGLFVHVPRGVILDAPLHHLISFNSLQSSLFFTNILIAEPDSHLALWEEVASNVAPDNSPASFLSGWNLIELQENAQLDHLKLQHLDTHVCYISSESITQERASSLHQLSMAAGSKMSKTISRTSLLGPAAHNEMLGVLFGDGQQQFDHWAFQTHVAPNTTSHLEYRGALKDSARSSFVGLVKIEKEAQKSNAHQSNRNLLLSREARADAIPKLEIIANDVQCGHASATGPVDPDQMFYLASRGLTPDLAERMIVEGFFEPVVSKIPPGPVLERVRKFLEEKLEGKSRA